MNAIERWQREAKTCHDINKLLKETQNTLSELYWEAAHRQDAEKGNIIEEFGFYEMAEYLKINTPNATYCRVAVDWGRDSDDSTNRLNGVTAAVLGNDFIDFYFFDFAHPQEGFVFKPTYTADVCHFRRGNCE